jgi:hypothetical protein
MRAVMGCALVVGLLAGAAVQPAAADEALLRRAFGAFMRRADELRIEAIPDLYEGGYARISVVARRVLLTEGLRVDDASIRLVGVTLDLAALRAGTLRVEDIRLWAEDGYLLGTGTVVFQGRPTRMRMKGFFAASGTTEVYFYFDSLHANGWPLPTAVIRDIERSINPVLHQRQWPVTFKIRSVRLDAQALTVGTHGETSCPACGGGEAPRYEP